MLYLETPLELHSRLIWETKQKLKKQHLAFELSKQSSVKNMPLKKVSE